MEDATKEEVKMEVVLTGNSLTPRILRQMSRGKCTLVLSTTAWEKVRKGRHVVDGIMKTGKVAYGINTGFGLFSKVTISGEQLGQLQENLIRSHAAGTGNYLTRERTRMILALRINTLSLGHSGISSKTLKQLIAAFNADCLSVVPEKGTVGASGDLAQLSHLALGLMGEGLMWSPAGEIKDAKIVLQENGLTPIQLGAKEGLAMINGTQLITSLGAEAVDRAYNVALCADVAVALSLEVLKGTPQAYHASIHSVRPHRGQNLVAARLRALLQPEDPSEIFKSHRFSGRVQDAYSLRCAPQVHGVVNDTIDFVNSVLTTEMNSATDNPMVFTGELGDEWVNLTSKDA
eukprot:g2183.t1